MRGWGDGEGRSLLVVFRRVRLLGRDEGAADVGEVSTWPVTRQDTQRTLLSRYAADSTLEALGSSSRGSGWDARWPGLFPWERCAADGLSGAAHYVRLTAHYVRPSCGARRARRKHAAPRRDRTGERLDDQRQHAT